MARPRRSSSLSPPAVSLLTLPLQLAWLLRDDVRGGADIADAEEKRYFLCWWLLYGRVEYPAMPPLEPRHLAVIRESVAVAADDGTRVALPRFAAYVWRRAAQRQTPASPRALGRLLALIWLQAVLPAGAAPWLPLDAIPLALEPDEETPALDRLRVSRFLRLVWDSQPALQQRFDLTSAAGQQALIAWSAQSFPDHPAIPSAAPVRRAQQLRPGGVNLVGFASGEFGLGEDVRMLAAALDAVNLPYCVIACDPLRATGRSDQTLAQADNETPQFDTTLLCMSGFDTASLWLKQPDIVDNAAYRIGCWPWELAQWPEAWHPAYRLVDELWVSSRFTADAFDAAAFAAGIFQFPMAVSVDRITLRSRDYFGLPERRFLFLYVFDSHSYLARKNPLAAIRAFTMAFPLGNEPVGLVLKTMVDDRNDPAFRELLNACRSDPRIQLIDETMPRGDVLGLIAACDSYISLHRAEGFGRTIAEAMLLRRPVIGTAYSGSSELIQPQTALAVEGPLRPVRSNEYPFGDGQAWADPDVDQAAAFMRGLSSDAGLRHRLAEAAYHHVAQRHSPGAVGARYAERLAALHR